FPAIPTGARFRIPFSHPLHLLATVSNRIGLAAVSMSASRNTSTSPPAGPKSSLRPLMNTRWPLWIPFILLLH
ncbi:MAG: hypothetical protein WCI73_20600, partial [Phycisphaerae bacterium]